MNIKITIKQGDARPLLVHKNQLSEAQFKKKNSLYQQPKRDNKIPTRDKPLQPTNKNSREEKSLRQTGLRSSGEEEARIQAEKKMMQDLDKISKNQASLEMVHNSNNILQKQNEILYQNQKVLHNMAKNSEKQQASKGNNQQVDGMLQNIKKQVDQMRKIKEQIEKASRQFAKTISEANKTGKQVTFQGVPNNVTEMNTNLKNLAQISKNHLEGLENMEAIKSLQNFNIQGYSQAITGLKKQIVQYQKQSQQIERQLKLRAAKLQQLQISPNFNEELLAPYENYLRRKAESIDLHALRDKIYEKIGHFDYSKFQLDISQIMCEAKGQIRDFQITCKQYRVDVPELKIDPRQLKNLQLKLPNALDQYKAERGIQFGVISKNANQSQQLSDSRNKKRRTGQAIVKMDPKKSKNQKQTQAIRALNSKPIDLATQVKFQKTNEPTVQTVLQNKRENDKKQVERNMKKGKVRKQDDDFEKYLQFRAKEQLEHIYKQKEESLKRKRNELLQTCKQQPEVYLTLNLQNQIKKQLSTQKKKPAEIDIAHKQPKIKPEQAKKHLKKQEIAEQKELKPINGHERQVIKSIGTEVLKEKLKNILGQANQRRNEPNIQFSQPMPHNQSTGNHQEQPKLQNIAQNFLSLINNTLTQVNTQISQTIQNKFEQGSLSKQKREYERRSPPKIQIPKLEEFRPAPIFNMNGFPSYPQQNYQHHSQPTVPINNRVPEPKIVPKNYDHLQIKDSLNYGDLQISDESYQQDFQ